MKRVIVCLSGILVLAAIGGTIYMTYTYINSRQVIEKETKVQKTEDKIKEFQEKSIKIEKELEEIKNQNQEKVHLLELWQKELEKVKEY